jgi:coenzyme F420-0:L-glutamate ligase/coenzyme F420-1:gamma-L-glutamate ligase
MDTDGHKPAPTAEMGDTRQRDMFHTLVRTRRSIRRYTGQPVARETLRQLLDAATWAPSAHNRQPWRFCVVTEQATKDALSARMGARWRADLAADGADPEFTERRVAVSHARITGAAALVFACMTMEEMDTYPDGVRAQAERTMATQSVALACQNLLLAAHHHGLGACWMCAPLFVPDLVRVALDLPEPWEPQALITLGYPAETKERDRAPLETRVLWR